MASPRLADTARLEVAPLLRAHGTHSNNTNRRRSHPVGHEGQDQIRSARSVPATPSRGRFAQIDHRASSTATSSTSTVPVDLNLFDHNQRQIVMARGSSVRRSRRSLALVLPSLNGNRTRPGSWPANPTARPSATVRRSKPSNRRGLWPRGTPTRSRPRSTRIPRSPANANPDGISLVRWALFHAVAYLAAVILAHDPLLDVFDGPPSARPTS